MTALLCKYFRTIPATADALPYICDSFASNRILNDGKEFARMQSRALWRVLAGGIGSAVVAVPMAAGYESEYAGWAAAIDGHVVAVYVRTQFRRQGVGSMLLTALTDSAPIRVGYWSDDAQAVADHGFPIEHDPTSYHTLLTFMRKSDDISHIQTKATGNEKSHRIAP